MSPGHFICLVTDEEGNRNRTLGSSKKDTLVFSLSSTSFFYYSTQSHYFLMILNLDQRQRIWFIPSSWTWKKPFVFHGSPTHRVMACYAQEKTARYESRLRRYTGWFTIWGHYQEIQHIQPPNHIDMSKILSILLFSLLTRKYVRILYNSSSTPS